MDVYKVYGTWRKTYLRILYVGYHKEQSTLRLALSIVTQAVADGVRWVNRSLLTRPSSELLAPEGLFLTHPKLYYNVVIQ